MGFFTQTHREIDLRKMTNAIQPCYSINFSKKEGFVYGLGIPLFSWFLYSLNQGFLLAITYSLSFRDCCTKM